MQLRPIHEGAARRQRLRHLHRNRDRAHGSVPPFVRLLGFERRSRVRHVRRRHGVQRGRRADGNGRHGRERGELRLRIRRREALHRVRDGHRWPARDESLPWERRGPHRARRLWAVAPAGRASPSRSRPWRSWSVWLPTSPIPSRGW